MKKLNLICAAVLCLALTGCGAAGKSARVACDAVSVVPDEAVALGAAGVALATGGKAAAAAEYVSTRPISRACAQWDAEIDLLDGADTPEDVGFVAPDFGSGGARVAFEIDYGYAAPLYPKARTFITPPPGALGGGYGKPPKGRTMFRTTNECFADPTRTGYTTCTRL